MKKAAIYMRVSTDRQAQEGDSIPAQRSALRKYIDDHPDMVFAGEYLDDGISGTKEERDELQRLLSDVRERKIDLVLVTKLDRLYRSIRHYLNLQDTLDRYNVNWMAIWEPIYDTSTPQGRLIINQMMSIAQFEAENTGQRIKQVFNYKVSQGEAIFGHLPPGLTIVDKHIVPNDDAPLIRRLFEYYDRCGCLAQTTREFMAYPLPHTKSGIKNLLTNRKYLGEYRNNSNYCEPIIDRELFENVQRKLSINIKKSQKRTYLFSGLIKCPSCGMIMTSGTCIQTRKNGTQRMYLWYRCNRYYSLHSCTCNRVIYEAALERYLLENIRKQVENLVLTATVHGPRITDNGPKISALEKRLERLKVLYIDGLITIDEYKTDREGISAEIAAVRAQKAPEGPNVDGLRDLLAQPFEAIYSGFTAEERRYFWRSLVRWITPTDHGYEITYL